MLTPPSNYVALITRKNVVLQFNFNLLFVSALLAHSGLSITFLFFISSNYFVCMKLIRIQYIFHLIINFYVIMLIFDGPCCTKIKKNNVYFFNEQGTLLTHTHHPKHAQTYQSSHIIPMNPKTCTHHWNP